MDPSRGLPRAVLRTCLGAALRGVGVPHRVVVHDVEDTQPGVYRWPDLSAPTRPGSLRDELYRVCFDQGLAHDAAFVVIGAIDVGTLDDRSTARHSWPPDSWRRLHLLAYALGASASGMTFLDSECGAPREGSDALLFTCVGVPEYASARGSLRRADRDPNGAPRLG